MMYQPGDYVCPADLPRPIVCRVQDVESLSAGQEVSQILKLEPLEGPWPAGTLLIRLDGAVVPVSTRQLWPEHPFFRRLSARLARSRARITGGRAAA